MIALLTPAFEPVISTVDVLHVGVKLGGSGESVEFAGMNGIVKSTARHFAFTAPVFNHRCVAILDYADAVDARTQNVEGQIRSINFKILILTQPLHADSHRTDSKLNLNRLIHQVQKRHTGVLRKIDGCRPNMQRGSGA